MKKISKLNALGKTVVFRKIEETIINGIHIPENYAGQRNRYMVVATGPDVERCAEGDHILLRADAKLSHVDPWDLNVYMTHDDEYVMCTVQYEDAPSIVLS